MPGGSARLFLALPVPAAARAAVAVVPTSGRLLGLGAFPSARRARVLWAGVGEDGGLLARLASLLAELPGESPREAFRPHCTLVRFDPPVRLPSLPDGPLGEAFPLGPLRLLRSQSGPHGAVHEALGEFPLGR